ncbi:MAG: alpha/beta fold hydrolase [Candidatus Rokuibacteriota bacterium]
MNRQFVLVHGMSHGAWAWDALRARLEKAGHHAVAVDLPGHGRRAHERARASIDTYAQAVADATMQAGMSRAIVVGHSMAGAVLPRVAELIEARVAHLVFLAAVVVPSGSTLMQTQIGAAGRAMLTGLARGGGGGVQYPAVMESARWMSDLPAGDARVVDALTRMTPQPLRPWLERIHTRRFWAMRTPRTYIRCLEDRAVVPAKAAEYAARLGVTPVDMPCAHNPMLSAVDALAKILEKITVNGRGA